MGDWLNIKSVVRRGPSEPWVPEPVYYERVNIISADKQVSASSVQPQLPTPHPSLLLRVKKPPAARYITVLRT
jgi:hypothetical protein